MDLMARINQPRHVTVTDVWGRRRDAEIYFGAYGGSDGFACPFCSSVTVRDASWPRCRNPGCEASARPDDARGPALRAALLDRAHEEALREEERRWRARNHEYAMRRIEEERTERLAVLEERRTKAIATGRCVNCATRDVYRPRWVKHRDGKDCTK
jgi:hypothetical protein